MKSNTQKLVASNCQSPWKNRSTNTNLELKLVVSEHCNNKDIIKITMAGIVSAPEFEAGSTVVSNTLNKFFEKQYIGFVEIRNKSY